MNECPAWKSKGGRDFKASAEVRLKATTRHGQREGAQAEPAGGCTAAKGTSGNTVWGLNEGAEPAQGSNNYGQVGLV